MYVYYVGVAAQVGILVAQAAGCEAIETEMTWAAVVILIVAALGGLNILFAAHCVAKSITPTAVQRAMARVLVVGGLLALTIHVDSKCGESAVPGSVAAGATFIAYLASCADGGEEERSGEFGLSAQT